MLPPALNDLLKQVTGYATRERRAILEALVKSPVPLTAKQLHAKAGRRTCDLATVHRTLNRLEKQGVVRGTSFGGTARWYELWDNANRHHHIFCTSCKHIEDIPLCEIEAFARYARRKKGYSVHSHTLELFGLCPICRKKGKTIR